MHDIFYCSNGWVNAGMPDVGAGRCRGKFTKDKGSSTGRGKQGKHVRRFQLYLTTSYNSEVDEIRNLSG